MDFNNFIENCSEKYSNRGVSAILIEVQEDGCHIMLCGKSKADDDTFGKPVVFADANLKLPLIEDKVFEVFDDWFKKCDTPAKVIGEENAKSGLTATVTKRCTKCSAPTDGDSELCTDCQAKSEN
jgi:hypothetical protein